MTQLAFIPFSPPVIPPTSLARATGQACRCGRNGRRVQTETKVGTPRPASRLRAVLGQEQLAA